MLLGPDRKDEVRVLLGEEGELVLRSFAPSLTAPLPASHRDHALDGVVSGALGVRFRIEEGEQALLLVVLEEPAPGEHRGAGAAHEHDRHVAPLDLGEHHHRHRDGEGDQRRPEVGLLHHQRDRQQDEREGPQQIEDAVMPLAQARLVAREPAGEQDDHRQLDEFAGLHLHRADLKPAPGPEHFLSREGDASQQSDGRDVAGPGRRLEPPVVGQEEQGDEEAAHQHPAELHQRHDHRRVLGGGGEVPDAERADDQRAQDQRPVQVVELLLGHAQGHVTAPWSWLPGEEEAVARALAAARFPRASS